MGCTREKQRLRCVERTEWTRSQAMGPGLGDAAYYWGWRTGSLIFCPSSSRPTLSCSSEFQGEVRASRASWVRTAPAATLPGPSIPEAHSSGVNWGEWQGWIISPVDQAGRIKVTRSRLATPSSPLADSMWFTELGLFLPKMKGVLLRDEGRKMGITIQVITICHNPREQEVFGGFLCD